MVRESKIARVDGYLCNVVQIFSDIGSNVTHMYNLEKINFWIRNQLCSYHRSKTYQDCVRPFPIPLLHEVWLCLYNGDNHHNAISKPLYDRLFLLFCPGEYWKGVSDTFLSPFSICKVQIFIWSDHICSNLPSSLSHLVIRKTWCTASPSYTTPPSNPIRAPYVASSTEQNNYSPMSLHPPHPCDPSKWDAFDAKSTEPGTKKCYGRLTPTWGRQWSPQQKNFYQVTPSEVQNGDNPWKNGTGHNPSNWEVVKWKNDVLTSIHSTSFNTGEYHHHGWRGKLHYHPWGFPCLFSGITLEDSM